MLYIWMPEADGAWLWSIGNDWQSASNLEQLIHELQPFQGQEAVVYFSSRNIQLIQQKISKQHVKQLGPDGIRYLLEEYVTLPIDQMQIVHHFKAPDSLTVMGVALSSLQLWQQSLSLLPIKLIALLPDFLLLPVPQPDQIILANVHQHTLARTHEFAGASIEDVGLFVSLIPLVAHYKYANLSEAQFDALLTSTPEAEHEVFEYQLQPVLKAKQHPLNVLPKPKSTVTVSSYWKVCAVILAAVILVQFSYDLLRWVQLKKVANQTAEQSIAQYKEWFGDNGRITEQNIKSLFESQLRLNQAGDTNALNLLSRVGPILMQRQISAQQVNYEANVLTMQLKANSSDDLQNLTKQLNQQGFKAELGQVQANGAGSLGMVKIQ
ncbi:type II secretion system protein GspL [uncultured Acinetobacter sp.]|uniref:type II secretion system protein GspL n=1 Tax=uncultured Acinetobacter sp. TaxID=165433 RepID=UPI00258B3F6E|nr:type II secretion system protein GspL [uncultured Acinetobacter sp.]